MAVTGILGKKIGMTQVFDEKGEVHPITVLQAGPCVITQLKTLARDGYDAAQIGLVEFVKSSKVNKPMAGHFAKSNVPPVKLVREVAFEASAPAQDGEAAAKAIQAGDKVLVDIFSDEKYVDVIGTSKGRGFSGVVRRHGFGGGPKAHGHMFQVQGSIGASSFPSRVFPGQRMPGHYGVDRVTVRNLRIRGIDLEENLLMVEGAVPGPRDGYVLISKSKAPPRERRGFGGSGTVDPLKASKKASSKKK
ncbi:MAG TPA: 50S ribosomal protein L3 [Acidisarcina sp.]|nr:50S ribosomal protein L3 [Acidisarcina sp.]